MKKSVSLLLTFILCITLLAGCGSKSPYAGAKKGDTIELGGLNWRVLEVSGGKALLISEKILEGRPYNFAARSYGDIITWEICELREYLNGSFYNDTFSEEEKEWIAESDIVNSDNPEFGTAGGNNTKDRIFLLSIEEAQKYFETDEDRTAAGSPPFYWLRSPGESSHEGSYVNSRGSVDAGGPNVGNTAGVRPALWLQL